MAGYDRRPYFVETWVQATKLGLDFSVGMQLGTADVIHVSNLMNGEPVKDVEFDLIDMNLIPGSKAELKTARVEDLKLRSDEHGLAVSKPLGSNTTLP